MYKRHTGQVSMLESPEMFGSLPLDPNNDWIKLSKLVPWREFDVKYADNFRSKKGQRAIDSRMALGALLIKPAYKALSDEDITKEIAMNPYLQYFLGLHEYRYECPFDPSMMTRFRQRITPEMLAWVNDQIIGRKTEQDKHDDNDSNVSGTGGQADENQGGESKEEKNEGTMILDATCAPQNIRFPTDGSLLNEAREKAEEIIDTLHDMGLSEGKKPRTCREKARRKYNCFSKSRKKNAKLIPTTIRQQLGYADVEFGAKVEMSVVDGFLRIEELRWDAFNESTTLQQSAEAYRKSYGHYPARVLADTIFRTRENLRYCKEHGIHLNGFKLGKPIADPTEAKKHKKLEWLESGERGEIERNFGVGKRCYSLDCIVTKLKETSEVMIHSIVIFMNLLKRLQLLLRSLFIWLRKMIQIWLEEKNFALA